MLVLLVLIAVSIVAILIGHPVVGVVILVLSCVLCAVLYACGGHMYTLRDRLFHPNLPMPLPVTSTITTSSVTATPTTALVARATNLPVPVPVAAVYASAPGPMALPEAPPMPMSGVALGMPPTLDSMTVAPGPSISLGPSPIVLSENATLGGAAHPQTLMQMQTQPQTQTQSQTQTQPQTPLQPPAQTQTTVTVPNTAIPSGGSATNGTPNANLLGSGPNVARVPLTGGTGVPHGPSSFYAPDAMTQRSHPSMQMGAYPSSPMAITVMGRPPTTLSQSQYTHMPWLPSRVPTALPGSGAGPMYRGM